MDTVSFLFTQIKTLYEKRYQKKKKEKKKRKETASFAKVAIKAVNIVWKQKWFIWIVKAHLMIFVN